MKHYSSLSCLTDLLAVLTACPGHLSIMQEEVVDMQGAVLEHRVGIASEVTCHAYRLHSKVMM